MNFKRIIYGSFLFSALLLSACGSDQTPESIKDDTPNKMTFDERNDRPRMAPQQDNAKAVRNFDAYTYVVEMEDSVFPVVTAEEKENNPKAVKVNQRNNDVPEKLARKDLDKFDLGKYMDDLEVEVDLMAAVDDLDLNRPPLFDRSCLMEAYPAKCSNEKIRAYLKSELDYPEYSIPDNYEGVEVVSIRINENGELEPGVAILTNTTCNGCAKAAAAVVSQMHDNWVPALKDGEVVSTRINIPIHFVEKGTSSLK